VHVYLTTNEQVSQLVGIKKCYFFLQLRKVYQSWKKKDCLPHLTLSSIVYEKNIFCLTWLSSIVCTIQEGVQENYIEGFMNIFGGYEVFVLG
jgi:hypothetical protein